MILILELIFFLKLIEKNTTVVIDLPGHYTYLSFFLFHSLSSERKRKREYVRPISYIVCIREI